MFPCTLDKKLTERKHSEPATWAIYFALCAYILPLFFILMCLINLELTTVLCWIEIVLAEF